MGRAVEEFLREFKCEQEVVGKVRWILIDAGGRAVYALRFERRQESVGSDYGEITCRRQHPRVPGGGSGSLWQLLQC